MKRVDHRIIARRYRSSLAHPSLIHRSAHLDSASSKMAESIQTGLPGGVPATQEKPPKLSLADFRAYNSMADHMELFVGITLYEAPQRNVQY